MSANFSLSIAQVYSFFGEAIGLGKFGYYSLLLLKPRAEIIFLSSDETDDPATTTAYQDWYVLLTTKNGHFSKTDVRLYFSETGDVHRAAGPKLTRIV